MPVFAFCALSLPTCLQNAWLGLARARAVNRIEYVRCRLYDIVYAGKSICAKLSFFVTHCPCPSVCPCPCFSACPCPSLSLSLFLCLLFFLRSRRQLGLINFIRTISFWQQRYPCCSMTVGPRRYLFFVIGRLGRYGNRLMLCLRFSVYTKGCIFVKWNLV